MKETMRDVSFPPSPPSLSSCSLLVSEREGEEGGARRVARLVCINSALEKGRSRKGQQERERERGRESERRSGGTPSPCATQ
eukprot:1791757-Rhodomonas_salina.1